MNNEEKGNQKSLKELKDYFDETMQFYHPQDEDGHQLWLDFIRKIYMKGWNDGWVACDVSFRDRFK